MLTVQGTYYLSKKSRLWGLKQPGAGQESETDEHMSEPVFSIYTVQDPTSMSTTKKIPHRSQKGF